MAKMSRNETIYEHPIALNILNHPKAGRLLKHNDKHALIDQDAGYGALGTVDIWSARRLEPITVHLAPTTLFMIWTHIYSKLKKNSCILSYWSWISLAIQLWFKMDPTGDNRIISCTYASISCASIHQVFQYLFSTYTPRYIPAFGWGSARCRMHPIIRKISV